MDRRRSPPGVRLGRGTLIDDDVRLGGPASSTGPNGLEIGRCAVIRGGSSIFDGVKIGDRLEAGHNVTIGENTAIGSDCRIGNNTIIAAGCTIGDRVRIDANCYIAGSTTIEDDARIASGVCMASDPHPGSQTQLCSRGPTIERGAQIGMNVTILPFVTIGERSLVGAGSVVTQSVPPGLVVVGNPARVLKSVARVTCPLDLPNGEYLRRPDER